MESSRREIEVMANLLGSNDMQAEVNRAHFRKNHCLAINVMGSPGAGKTSLLEKSLPHLNVDLNVGVIEGDIFTSKDADRIAVHEVPVIQINTGGACHLDSKMVSKVLPEFDWNVMDLMVIENVGNLVCPADFDLGEAFKVIVLSIVEGDDKPAKYPVIFRNAKAVVLNKMDLEGLTDVNMETMRQDIRTINPDILIFEVSCRNGNGLKAWTSWLTQEVKAYQGNKG
ncbi:hydrogenase nickel incorporation protein HypB [Desulfosporosinus metallidurans]|uniref:[NiFe] hydrogenase nickel incorporation-associated protein HypB n=1 Tax=Desulfosporosinus metallidurans TaxID=1888891 RepID=A0A1Q8QY66_9FIRM|nr:hydrogenase nickel incorporation protein HypB [Desulfosporosinus metallidurans]OLN32309.1 [NiFe] hydrogenase nickel incorporation-associated protein HypB [Desulfosporosinus metallidurans]